jgi:hypothetical protein
MKIHFHFGFYSFFFTKIYLISVKFIFSLFNDLYSLSFLIRVILVYIF